MDDVVFIDDEIHNTFKSTEISHEDVFLNITGASIGRSAIAEKSIVGGNVNQHVCIIRTKKNELYPYYLNAFLLSQKGQNLIDSYQAGGNRQGLNFEQIKSFKIPLPSYKEQTAIANLLSTWDRAIQTTTQLIAQKEQRKKWLMQQLLTGKKRLKEFNGEWKEILFGDFAEIVMGQSPEGSTYNNTCNGIALINGPTEFTEKYPIKVQWTTSPTKICKEGDILLCVRGSSTGRLNIANEKYCIGRGIAAIRAKKNSDHSFLEFLVENVVNKILSLTAGSTFPNIDSKSLRSIEVSLPHFPEQTAIASVLQAADKEIQLLKAKADQLKQQKKGLMQQLLTGKKRLNYDLND